MLSLTVLPFEDCSAVTQIKRTEEASRALENLREHEVHPMFLVVRRPGFPFLVEGSVANVPVTNRAEAHTAVWV